jgi:uncharacterized coiled-coil DUF342 family protein
VAAENDQLRKLRAARNPDKKEIADLKATRDQNLKDIDNLVSAHRLLVKGFSEEKKGLIDLSKQYQDASTKLDTAKQTLDDAKKQRDDAIASFTNQYSTLPNITPESDNQLGDYTAALQNQVNAVAAYQSTLDQLRQLGLDDKTYQKLLQEGTADQQFAEQLLAGGATAIQGLNTLDAQLDAASQTLAQHAGLSLYQAGVEAAQGVVNGLESKQSEIYKAMEKIAEKMIKALKKKLKIKSPSQVFAELGRFTLQGFSDGIDLNANIATKSAENIGDNVVKAMRSSIDRINDMALANLDMDPTITPILDLSNVEKQAKKLADLTNVTPITAASSFDQASLISVAQQAAQQASPSNTDAAVAQAAAQIVFEQNNYSPESLSPAEIYRLTKNQLAQAKSLLGVA